MSTFNGPRPEPSYVGQGEPSTLPRFHFHDDTEAEATEQRIRLMRQMYLPADLVAAQDAVEAARVTRAQAYANWKARSDQERECRAAMQRTAPDQPGLKADRQSALTIARGYLQVAEFNLQQADETLRTALEKLAAVTGASDER